MKACNTIRTEEHASCQVNVQTKSGVSWGRDARRSRWHDFFVFAKHDELKDTGGSRDTGTTGSKTPGRGGSIAGAKGGAGTQT